MSLRQDVTFIFSSVLYTKQDWLNYEIAEFNKIMFELSVTIPNLRFLDTHQSLLDDGMTATVKPEHVRMPEDANGQHLTLPHACQEDLLHSTRERCKTYSGETPGTS